MGDIDAVDELVGLWSSEATGLYYSSFGEDALAFAADGTGWQEQYPYRVIRFTWRRVAAGELVLTCHERLQYLDGALGPPQPHTASYRIAYQIQEEDTPFEGRRVILRIDPAVDFAHEFGRVSRDPSPCEHQVS